MWGEDNRIARRTRVLAMTGVLSAVVICALVLQGKPTASVVWSTAQREPGMLAIGSKAPSFTLPGSGGVAVSLAELHGGQVALAFVTAGCPHCNKLYARLDSLVSPPKREIILICHGPASDAVSVAQSHTFPFRVLADSSGATHRQYQISGVPTVYLLDEHDLVRDVRTGWPAVWALLAP